MRHVREESQLIIFAERKMTSQRVQEKRKRGTERGFRKVRRREKTKWGQTLQQGEGGGAAAIILLANGMLVLPVTEPATITLF